MSLEPTGVTVIIMIIMMIMVMMMVMMMMMDWLQARCKAPPN